MIRSSLLLAYRYMEYYRGRTFLLIAAVSLTLYLPFSVHWTLLSYRHQILQRSRETPLVLGVKGSRFGLMMHALYFRGETPDLIEQAELNRFTSWNLGEAIPLFVKFRASGFAVVGTTPSYFSFRRLELSEGAPLERLGDCVVGAMVARNLGLRPGDRLLTDPEHAFDLSGPIPLKMRVTGILQATSTADDEAIFTDLRTTWILQGIGHGHALKESDSEGESHRHDSGPENRIQYHEVTEENLKTFHFHGDSQRFPLSAIVVLPNSEKSAALLLGKYLDAHLSYQLVRPMEVADEMLHAMGQIERLFDIIVVGLVLATAILGGLVMMLSIKLRQRELETMSLLGAGRLFVVQLIATELTLIFMASLGIAILLASITASTSSFWMNHLVELTRSF